ncbi:Protein EXORDIUM-like [Actinidia chinensis var. chinensis]|uniref:Protein EXORDIUM-like n=1 Tax=Actinidia chinensis var. chinensis TaxID=1590841 RepID=A0A2R6P6A0_ACTCC|nr:Protein EXORDIUM-like [Actinidia chinensis var. chinensis]
MLFKSLPLFLLLPFNILIALAIAPVSQALNHNLNQPSSLVPPSTILTYHGGPILNGPSPISIYLIWYGSFYQKDRAPITDFFASFSNPTAKTTTVATWWNTILSYKDKAGNSVSSKIRLAKQLGDVKYSLGKNIKRAQITTYVKNKIDTKLLPSDPNGIYLVLTSKDVVVEQFCMNSCGFHSSIVTSTKRRLVYAHVGDPAVQCPGLCAWPYAIPAYGPPGQALVAPNGIGTDGIIMNIATVLAGATTNPFMSGYFQGDALAPLEAVTACPGIFGAGAYPGYPGDLKVDKMSKASYNAYGVNGRKFLLPTMWDPVQINCKVVT